MSVEVSRLDLRGNYVRDRVRLKKLLGKVVKKYIFRARLRQWFKYRSIGPEIIMSWLGDVLVKQAQDKNICADTIGRRARRYYRCCKQAGRLIDQHAAKWRARKRALVTQWMAAESSWMGQLEAKMLTARRKAEKSLKYGDAKEMRASSVEQKKEMIAAMRQFEFEPSKFIPEEVS